MESKTGLALKRLIPKVSTQKVTSKVKITRASVIYLRDSLQSTASLETRQSLTTTIASLAFAIRIFILMAVRQIPSLLLLVSAEGVPHMVIKTLSKSKTKTVTGSNAHLRQLSYKENTLKSLKRIEVSIITQVCKVLIEYHKTRSSRCTSISLSPESEKSA